MNKIKNMTLILSSLVLISCGDSSSHTNTEKISSIIKKTSQTKSYDTDGEIVNDNTLKDDGFYQKGIDPNYTRDDNTQIVTDHVTGLEWEDTLSVSSETKTWLNKEVTQKCRDGYGNPMCPDEGCDICSDISGDTATTYCSALELSGGGWRLPTAEELFFIVDKSKTKPSINSIFKNTNSNAWYYTSTFSQNYFLPLTVDFNEGYSVIDFPKLSPFRASTRCVRGDNPSSLNREFIRNSQGLVQETKTKLEWQDNYDDNGETIKKANWKDAIEYCEFLELNGTNWRLPNIHELYTILDEKGELHQDFIFRDDYAWWSSTTYGGNMGGVFLIDNAGLNTIAWVGHGGKRVPYYSSGASKNREQSVRCVRDIN
jgi:hypothetical protein